MSEISKKTKAHDGFVKLLFNRLEIAKEFFSIYLPAYIGKLLDFDSLEPQKDTFVDGHLNEYFSDLLFTVSLKDKKKGARGYIYILFEHKSFQDPMTGYHLLRYMVRISCLVYRRSICTAVICSRILRA